MTSSTRSDAAVSAGERAPSGYRLPRAARLRRSRDLLALQRGGRRIAGPLVDVMWTESPAGRPRVAVVVPRFGHTAVDRNRVRRRLLEIARTAWLPRLLAGGSAPDFLLRAKPSAYGVSYERLSESLVGSLETLCARC